MYSRLMGMGLLALLLVACNTPTLPRYKATLGTYSVKDGKTDKLGIALLSSFDRSFPIPPNGFEVKILGPGGFRASHTFRNPAVNQSDWFADPDLEVEDGTYAVVAIINGHQYQSSHLLDTDSFLDYPEAVTLEQVKSNRLTASWDAVDGSKVYYVTLNQKVPGQVKPLVVRELYTTDLEFTFDRLSFKVNLPYFVAVGALSLDPRQAHSGFSQPFNASYGQTSKDFVVSPAGALEILAAD